jgi:fused signal recognition particle receptor
LFSFIKNTIVDGIKKVKEKLVGESRNVKEAREALRKTLIENNFGPNLADQLVEKINFDSENWIDGLKSALIDIIDTSKELPSAKNEIYILVGINGSGKTTSTVKLAKKFIVDEPKTNGSKANRSNRSKTIVIPADKFRAAAFDQLNIMCEKESIDIFDDPAKEPSTLVYSGVEDSIKKGYSKIVIDTAGRIHQSENLLKELKKIQRVAKSQANGYLVKTLIVLDSLQGQALERQVGKFSEHIDIDGIIVTKLDAGSKPGVIFSIVNLYKIPVVYLSSGEYGTTLVDFEKEEFVESSILRDDT